MSVRVPARGGVIGSEADHPVIPSVTLPEFVLGGVHQRGDKRALVDAMTGRSLSYRELAIAVGRVGAGLAAQGVRAGDVVALCAPNSIEFVVAWYAASTIGAILTTLNPLLTGEEITHLLRQSGARWLVTTAEQFDAKTRSCAIAAGVRKTVLVGAAEEEILGAIRFESLCSDIGAEIPTVRVDAGDVAFLPCSSGTTGLPKSVVLTHHNLVTSLCQTRLVHNVREEDVVIAVLPLFHVFGFQVTLNLALLQGATVVILPRFDLDAFLLAVQNHAVSRAEVVPPIVLALATSDRVDAFDLSSLRVVMAGAAPLGADLARACAARIGCRIKQGYGMTELGGSSHIAPDDGFDRPESIGPALPGIECRVIDYATGADVGPDEPGELLIRSAAATRCYLDNPDATAATIDADGWLHTGDIVTVDPDGWFQVTDRIKELIKCKGFQVAPAELEKVLLTHPAVGDAAVVRTPDGGAGEVPKAFVVLHGTASHDELIKWVAERVAPYKRVRRVEFVDHIPKSPSGKILRRLLIEHEQATNERALPRRRRDRAMNGPSETATTRHARREFRVDGSVALVTGGGRGLGQLLARTLAHAGAAVALIARSSDELATTVEQIESAGGVAAAASADVTDEVAVTAALARLRAQLGPVDVLINNAGINGPMGVLWETDSAEWWRTIEVNLGGAFMLTRILLPDMIAARRGRIINVTSNAGVYRWPLVSAYVTSKAALIKLTETLAAETAGHGVSVLSVDPGLLPIGLSDAALTSTAEPDTSEGRVFGWIRNQLNAGRGADPDQAAQLILELASGHGDRLSGRHLTAADDLEMLLAQIDKIQQSDLHTLRLSISAP